MKLKHYLIPAVALLFTSCQQNSNFAEGLLEVEGGQIQGYKDEGLTIFKGIPFAAPPVGEFRWKAPQPVVPWDTILQATNYAAGPIQGAPSAEYSEDCLYLNVWTPAKTADEKLPVLVWIYGGGFSFGNTADPNYDCEALARSTDGLILASINYRVGQLGFLALPELSAESPDHVSGNYGLQDQIAGLAWLKRNIAKFGGDPERITIFGESAGGISVSMLCASPLCKDLFQGAISQSGGSFGPSRPVTYPGENMKTLANAEQDGLKIMENLGASSLAELRAMDAWKFAGRGLGAGGWPVVDGFVISDDQSVCSMPKDVTMMYLCSSATTATRAQASHSDQAQQSSMPRAQRCATDSLPMLCWRLILIPKKMEASRVATSCAMPHSDGRHGNGLAFRTRQASRRSSSIISTNILIIQPMTRISDVAHTMDKMLISYSSTLPISNVQKSMFLSL